MVDRGAPLMTQLLRLEDVLSDRGAPAGSSLAHPRPAEQVRDRLTSIGVLAHPDLLTWWTWHDGAPTDQWRPQYCLISMYWPYSLTIAERRWRVLLEAYEPESPVSAPPHCFPVAGWDNRGNLCVDTRTGEVGLDDSHCGEYEPYWPSMAAWVADVLTFYESGAVVVAPGDIPEIVIGEWPATVRRSMYW